MPAGCALRRGYKIQPDTRLARMYCADCDLALGAGPGLFYICLYNRLVGPRVSRRL